jgi:nitrogen regulatory protein P-II 1
MTSLGLSGYLRAEGGSKAMFKIEAVIQASKLASVKACLEDLGIGGISISDVLIQSGPSSQKLFYRGAEYSADSAMLKLEILVSSFRLDEVVDAISRAARTNLAWDDGTIVVCEVADAIRIRSGERVEFALS